MLPDFRNKYVLGEILASGMRSTGQLPDLFRLLDQFQDLSLQLLVGFEENAGHPILDNLLLPSSIEHHRDAGVLHRFDRGHAEMLDSGRITLPEAAEMPEQSRAAVFSLELIRR